VCFILVETKRNSGHWIAVLKLDKNNIEVFNSYSGFIDMELNYVPQNLQKVLNEDYPHLTALLLKSKYNIHYNDHPFQSKSDNIATCGRHCIVRALNRKMDIDEYDKFIKSQELKPDEFVTAVTLNMVPGS
jgi:hypothetical protein